jgi:hypothetical protein
MPFSTEPLRASSSSEPDRSSRRRANADAKGDAAAFVAAARYAKSAPPSILTLSERSRQRRLHLRKSDMPRQQSGAGNAQRPWGHVFT